WNNGTTNFSYSNPIYHLFSEGFNTITAYANDTSGNLNSTSVSFWVDTTGPSINLISPESKTYGQNIELPLDFVVSDSNGVSSCWYNLNSGYNVSLLNCQNTTFDASDGNYILNFFSNDTLGNLNKKNVSFSVSTEIAVVLVSPFDSEWLNYQNVELNYTVSTLADIYNCSLYGNWGGEWHLNQTNLSAVNQSGGINSFNVFLPDGNYLWNIYCDGFFDSFAFSNFTLNIDTQEPVLNMYYPLSNNLLKRNVSLLLNFTIFDDNLEECWYTLDNGQTNISLGCSEGDNYYYFSYLTGNFNLSVYASDFAGNSADTITSNLTIMYDGISPNVSLLDPQGVKTSASNIFLNFLASDNADLREEMLCWFSVVYASTGGSVPGLESLFLNNCQDTIFNLIGDGNYILNLVVRDKTGNAELLNTTFSVSTGTSIPPGGGSSGGGSSSGGSFVVLGKTKLEVESLFNSILFPGDNKKISWNVKNTGTNFLNTCKFKGNGEFSSWISSSESLRNLAAGEEYDFIFDLNVPDDVETGLYNLEIKLDCKEINKTTGFVVEVVDKEIGFELIKVEREKKDQIKILYSLQELSNLDQKVELQFLLFGSNGEKVAELEEFKELLTNSEQEFESFILIDSFLEGELNLLININSETYSGFVQENLVLGAPATGLPILGDLGTRDNIVSVIMVVLFLIFAFFVVRKIFGHKKEIKRRKSVKVVKKGQGSRIIFIKKKKKKGKIFSIKRKKKKFPL
ncbi:MAG: hypothetical protein KKF48_01480, partial [Nanoarchaeota archaeon]|nr:hypothetical protein [Nanoarchaeota archaeon]